MGRPRMGKPVSQSTSDSSTDSAGPKLPSEFNEMPDDAKALMHLMQSLVMVSFPIEVWKQPRVLDSGATYIELVREPVV